MRRKLIVLLISLFTICSFIGIKAYALSNEGKVIVDKSSVKDDLIYGRSANVTLNVSGIKKDVKSEMEIVFVLDRSSSMDNKISSVKNSFTSIIDSILPNDNIKIGVVTFGRDVFSNYSTSSLSNDGDKLKNLVNLIPNDSSVLSSNGVGTNISAGLDYANKLFTSKDNTKAIILLSDGYPTYFTYKGTIYGTGKSNSSMCVDYFGIICKKSYRPSEYTKIVSDNIRKDKSIYAIGYSVNDNTKSFLTSISSKYYDVKNESELTLNFTNIIKSINIIAKDVIITDIVPAYFDIDKEKILKDYPGSVVYENTDGSYTLNFKLNNIDSNVNYTFTYKVTLKENYYGNVYTNNNAYISGKSLIDNVYENNNVYEVFPKPSVNIPCVTYDDSYYVKLGNTLNIDNLSGILANDKLSLINDTNKNIVNKIVVSNTDNSCGDIKVNDDGSFKYIPNSLCLNKENTFSYYVETKVDNDVVRSNSSLINIRVDKDSSVIDKDIITKDATLEIKEDTIIDYNINYNTVIKNYIGNVNVIITDYLPCEIDLEESSLEGAVYDSDKLTLTWNFDINDVDTYLNGNKLINIDKDIKIKYVDVTNYKKLTNKVKGKVILSDKEKEVSSEVDTLVNIKGNVIVKYVDTLGNSLMDDVIITDLVGNDYITKEENFENYKLVNVKGDVFGKISKDDIIVIYEYYLSEDDTSGYLSKTGIKKIDNLSNRIDYNISYRKEFDNYIGKAKIEIIDILPYKIDLDNSNIGKFTYKEEENILYYSEEVEINTYTDGNYLYDFNNDITIKYKGIDVSDRVIENKVSVIIYTDKEEEYTDSFITNIEIRSNVTAVYVNKNGNRLCNDVVSSNLIGNSYVLDKKDIKGYKLVSVDGDVVGVYTDKDIVVTFTYDLLEELPPKTGVSKWHIIFILSLVLLFFGICLKRKVFN